MPVFVGAVKAVTYEELMPFFSSKEYLQKRVVIEEKKPVGMKRLIKGGNGRKALIAFDSLPLRIQKALSNDKEPSAVGQFFQIDLNAQKFFYEEFRLENGSSLRDKDKELYTTNASVINAVLQLKKERETIVFQLGKKKPAKLWECLLNDMLCFADRLATDYHRILDLPTNIRAFERVVKKYQSEGYSSLVSGKYLNQNRRKATENVTKLLDSMFATQSHKPTPTEVARQYEAFVCGMLDVINNETGELYAPCDFSPISQSTITAYLRTWDCKIGTYKIRRNDREKMISKLSVADNTELPKYAGSLISVDDRQPPFEYESGKRMWFYLGQDVASRCIITWVFGDSKEGIIIEFYRQMVRNYYGWRVNLPYEIECESNLNSVHKDTFLKEGVMFQSIRIEANNPRGKYIEAGANNELRYKWEKKYEGWKARPTAKKESNQSDGKEKKVEMDYIINIALDSIQNFNNTEHPVCAGKSRFEYFLENQNPDLPQTNYQLVIRQIGYKTKTSCRVGKVSLNGESLLLGISGQICIGKNLINLMKLVEGESLDVYWLDDNQGKLMKAYAYIGDKFMCELFELNYQRAKCERTKEDEKKRSLMAAYKMTIEHYATRRKQDIDSVTIIDNRPMTLNDKFDIRALTPFGQKSEKTDIIDTSEFAETLPELNEIETMIKDNLIGVETQQSRPLFNGNF